nr:Na/Pi symporter [uncultured Rhodoferax sp.]
MDILSNLLAGLGLFFIGIRLISKNVRQLMGIRLRNWIGKVVAGQGTLPLFGLAAGALVQSVNAIIHILVAMVTARAMAMRQGFAIVRWANVGTSALVLLATINMHAFILCLLGVTGVAYYRNLDDSTRYRHLVAALLGLGLLFLGVDFIKGASGLLKKEPLLIEFLATASRFPWLGFLAGTLVASVVQSSTTVSVVAMAMAAAGLLDFSTGAWIVVGASQGAAIATWLTGQTVEGSTRQLVLYQIAFKTVGVLLVGAVLIVDAALPASRIAAAFAYFRVDLPTQLALMYCALQIASDVGMRGLAPWVLPWLARVAPQSVGEQAGQPVYLHDQALDEAETALMLLDLEQQRLLTGLLVYLDAVREESLQTPPRLEAFHQGACNVTRLCQQFVTEVVDRHHSRNVLERSLTLRDRNELLGALQASLMELRLPLTRLQAAAETRGLMHSLAESLHLMLGTLAEAAQRYDADDVAMLRMLTHDRSELMDSIRRRSQVEELEASQQDDLYQATTLFERIVWLLRRYVLALDSAAGGRAPV